MGLDNGRFKDAMSVSETIETKLRDRLSPDDVRVIDESDKHKGHSGWRPGGETHFRVEIVAAAFDGMTRVDRQRLVYEVLTDELRGPVHALSLDLKTPAEIWN
jgi:BolA protein